MIIIPFYDEIFLDIYPFGGDYQVSNYGRVISWKDKDNPRLLSQKIDKDGYCEVGLWVAGRQHMKKVHQLVAMEFLDNNDLKYQINHKDFNRKNNKVNNLEWATHQEDANHRKENNRFIKGEKHYGYGKFRGESKTAKLVLDLNTGIFYDCAKDAAEAKCIKYSTLKGYLNGNDKNYSSLVYV